MVIGGDDALQFDAMVEALDTELGRLLDAVPEATAIFVADNGTPTPARRAPYVSNRVKGALYQGGVRVPLCIAGPGIQPGVHDGLVQTTDLFATVADVLGVPTPTTAVDSISLTPVLADPAAPGARSFVYVEQNRNGVPMGNGTQGGYAYTDGQFKALFLEDGTEELYAIGTDPLELTDLASDPAHTATLAQLRAAATALRAGTP